MNKRISNFHLTKVYKNRDIIIIQKLKIIKKETKIQETINNKLINKN
jgi:hypothetical protein